MPQNRTAYIGLWTNHQKGPILGSTLTVKEEHGAVLVALLALLVGWAGAHVWGIVCFIAHQLRTGGGQRDILHLQQQVLLRNRESELGTIYRLWQIGWAWRSHTDSSIVRTLPLALMAAVNLAGFLIAGIFSSQVMKTGGEVLAYGQCGFLDTSVAKPFPLWTEDDWIQGDAIFVGSYTGWRLSASYARSCYGADYLAKGTASCQTYPIPAIQSQIKRQEPCPFAEGTCTEPAITLDTGKIDSDLHLGINARPKDRMQMRKVTSCAPIRVEGKYDTNWTSQSNARPGTDVFYPVPVVNDTYKYYDIGPSMLFDQTVSNFTFILRNSSLVSTQRPYTLYNRGSSAGNSTISGFLPIPDFNRTDADVEIMLLHNKVAYTGEVTDPWFRASVRGVSTVGLNEAWFAPGTLSGMGCTEQWQFCNGEICDSLAGMNAHKEDPPTSLGLNDQQRATYRVLWQYAQYSKMDSIFQFIRDEVLLAQQLVYGSFGISGALPNHHWQKEMENLHNITMASLQGSAGSHIWTEELEIRPGIGITNFIIPETTPENLNICRNQKMRNKRYASFNMFGFMMIVIASIIVTCLNLYMAEVVGWIQARRRLRVATIEWTQDDIFNIQRTALESRGIGPWKRDDGSSVPVTEGYGVRIPLDMLYSAPGHRRTIYDDSTAKVHQYGQPEWADER